MLLQVDGTPGDQSGGQAGVGVVVRGLDGTVLRWHTARVPAHTCNEAEYQAVIVGLQFVRHHYPAAHVVCLTDSRVVAEQMNGRAAVRTGPLQPLHAEATARARRCPHVLLIAIPRGLNRIADALAWEALGGRQQIREAGRAARKQSH